VRLDITMRLLLFTSVFLLLTGCGATYHKQAVQDNSTDRVTVGSVQKEIKVGMSGAEVAAVLGSPNIVSTDSERREVWIYDKISTDVVRSNSSGGVMGLIFGGSGGGLGSTSYSAGAASKSQKTLTVIIKFNTTGQVRDFAYHTSRF